MKEYSSTSNSTSPASASPDWQQRASLSLEQQWSLAQDLLALGRRTLAHHAAQSHRPASLAQVERILHLATRLARLSTDLAQQSAQSGDQCPKCCAARQQWEAALHKIYGQQTDPVAPVASPVEHTPLADTCNPLPSL